MIRGMVGVVPRHAMEAGRFCMASGYQDGCRLFQCFQTTEPLD